MSAARTVAPRCGSVTPATGVTRPMLTPASRTGARRRAVVTQSGAPPLEVRRERQTAELFRVRQDLGIP